MNRYTHDPRDVNRCHNGNVVKAVKSTFSSDTDDRQWAVTCTTAGQYISKSKCEDLSTSWTDYKMSFDVVLKSHSRDCLFKHGVMTGWESEFDTSHNDRRLSLKLSTIVSSLCLQPHASI